MFFGSHLIGKQVKQTKVNEPVKTINQSSYDFNDRMPIPVEVVDQEPKLKLGSEKPSWPLKYQNTLSEDIYQRGHNQWGGYGNLMGKGLLGEKDPAYEQSRSENGKQPFDVPNPRPSFELERRLKLRKDYQEIIMADQYESCPQDFVTKSIPVHDMEVAHTRSHQRGYRSTTSGAHVSGLGYRVVNGKDISDPIRATFRMNDHEQVRYDDPNKWANQYRSGLQKFIPYDGFGVPQVKDGIDSILLQSRARVPDVVPLPRGNRTGGYNTGYKNLRRPQHVRSQQ